jgi:hypothetical protein
MRWDETRAQAYADYARAVKSLFLHCQRMANPGDVFALPAGADHQVLLAELDRLAGDTTAAWELVLLLGDPAAVAAGRIWHRRIGLVEVLARGQQGDAIDYQALYGDIEQDRARFYQAARYDLGIDPGDVPLGGPWDTTSRATPARCDPPRLAVPVPIGAARLLPTASDKLAQRTHRQTCQPQCGRSG